MVALKKDRPIKLLVLETDILPGSRDCPMKGDENGAGSIGSAFQSLFTHVGQRQDPPLSVEVSSIYIVGNTDDPSQSHEGRLPELKEMKDYDGVLITGSKHDAHGDSEWIVKLLDWLRGTYQSETGMTSSDWAMIMTIERGRLLG